jgi:hypothetical protein
MSSTDNIPEREDKLIQCKPAVGDKVRNRLKNTIFEILNDCDSSREEPKQSSGRYYLGWDLEAMLK